MAKGESRSAGGEPDAGKRAARERRLGEALRRNLQLRKQQQRGRSTAGEGTEASGQTDPEVGPGRRGGARD
jgi:hypothetical protein